MKPRDGTLERVREQAVRTAWKLLYDWVTTQVAMIQLEQARASEVFMPYLYDARRDRTLYETWEATSYKALLESAK